MSSFSRVTFVFVLFRFRRFAFTEAAALRSIVPRSIVLRYACTPRATRSYPTILCVFFFFLFSSFSCFFGDIAFSEYFCTITFTLCMENTSYVFLFQMAFFYLVTTGWIFYISLCENSKSKSLQRNGSDEISPEARICLTVTGIKTEVKTKSFVESNYYRYTHR